MARLSQPEQAGTKFEIRNRFKLPVTTQVDRLKVDRLKEKICAIIIALQSSAFSLNS
jgi:hypothetical protein